MGIKLKNKFIYVITFIIGCYMLGLALLSSYDFIKCRNYLVKEPYAHSTDFENKLVSYFQSIYNIHIYAKNYEKKSDDEKINQEKMEQLKREYYYNIGNKESEIRSKYTQDIANAESQGDKNKVIRLTEEKNKKLDEITKANSKTEEQLKKEFIEKENKSYEQTKKYIKEKNDIKYYIRDGKSKETYTNLGSEINIEDYIKNKALYSVKLPLKYGVGKEFKTLNRLFQESTFDGYLIIPKEVDGYSQIIANYKYYDSIRSRVIKEGIIGVCSLAIGAFILLCIKKQEELEMPFLNKIKKFYGNMPLDLRIFMFVIYTFIMCAYLTNLVFFYKPFRIDHAFKLTIVTAYVIYFIFNAKVAIRFKKNRQELLNQWQGSLLYKLSTAIRGSIINKNIKLKIIAGIVFPIAIGAMIVITMIIVGYNTGECLNKGECLIILMIYSAIYVFAALRYIFKKVDLLNKILKGTEEIVLGNLDYVLEEQGEGALSKLAYNINNMKTGYKKSVEEQVKSERLKSELITNVSHDLKTPLTSIINYINLLKKDDLPEEQVKAYISVLERKAERLRVLIEDLFEAAKMSSGSVKLNIEKVDVKALLKQSIAELDEKIKNASLTVKFKCSEKNIYANLDGKKTWRVFENLINNIIKYSQVNTRVYIDLMEENEKIIIIMKNISSYEMDFDVKEIFHRFKRGDKSRNTEGSGLGLAIANGIIHLQGGDLKVQIDGDLFKVIVVFYKEKL